MAILTGTLGDDEIEGTNNGDLILGLTGNDVIFGLGGADSINGGAGDDILYAATAAIWRDGDVDTVLGGAGNDIIYGAYGDILDGGTGFDRLNLDVSNADRGLDLDFRPTTIGIDIDLLGLIRIDLPLGEGRLANIEVVDRLIGTEFDDVFRMANARQIGTIVNAGAGNDVVRSVAGDNRLFGEAGNDQLVAGRGADLLNGGDGNDRLTGGRGKDTLIGGAGRDIFSFAEGDSGTVRANADLIVDFSQSERDLIDLSRIDAIEGTEENDAFTFIGKDRFSGNAGEVRFIHVDDSTFVIGDSDGDLRADFQIRLQGQFDLTVADFRL